ncbi:hypothetical protein BKA66DRAFT_609113 [Pyrenochaeta sp. MPI-SDFR-AT-0127]|nr:hypothetical protein BKA66DRAFT_609113 [Pyrenochaeta sp. MPI-SDFR-AT-0127]
MASILRARGNAQGQKNVVTNGKKRKRDGTPNVQPVSGPKKRKGNNSTNAVPDKKTTCQKAVDYDDIIKDFRITFHSQKFRLPHPGVPLEHQTKFDHVQQLGQMKYDSYALQPRPDIINKPWELENKLRAKRIIQKAELSRDSYQNEGGWRMELENRVFERFDIEVACQQCRKRLWQSYIQADPTESNSRTSFLAERQKRRTICECEPLQKQYSILSTGLSEIFSTRIGERSIIQGDPENHLHTEQEPDRIYGLRTTGTMDKIMQQSRLSHLKEGCEKANLMNGLPISCNPDSGGKASIYPFLVMEAKSLKGGSNFKSIEAQTAVPIRNQLYLQLKLQEDEFNRMKVPGGPLTWFFAYIGEMWRVYGCYVTKSNPDNLPYYNIVLLWEGSITSNDQALQLVLIVDYIVDWARDIYRPSIMRQLMSVADKGSRSTYTIIEEPDILSIHGYASSWLGERPGGSIAGAEAIEPPPDRIFDALEFTIEPSLEPLFESTGEHVDIRVWDSAKYESRVRGLYITENDSTAMNHFWSTGIQSIRTVYMGYCWIVLSRAQDIKTIEEIWTGSQEIKDVNDDSSHRVFISLCVEYRKDDDGALIRELTYLALSEAVAKRCFFEQLLPREDLYVSTEELGLKLREGWASSNENYFPRFAERKTSVLCITASEFDRVSNRVTLSFREDRETTPYARRLNRFIKRLSENPRSRISKDYNDCLRDTKAIHSLIIGPYSIKDPTQACVFINGKDNLAEIWVYVTNEASAEIDTTWLIRQLVQMLAISMSPGIKTAHRASWESYCDLYQSKIIRWIVSEPQWDLYLTIRSTMMMPSMDRVHEYLAWYHRVLLRHNCDTGNRKRVKGYRCGYTNFKADIQDICKKCAKKWI